jgi:cytosine/adenosine deaminase-related metal-dependent hydrolase
VFLDLNALHYVPMNDLAQQIVFGEDGTGVEHVMSGGRFIVRDRKVLNVDVAKLKVQAEEAVARLAAANAEAKALAGKLLPYVGQFCAGIH